MKSVFLAAVFIVASAIATAVVVAQGAGAQAQEKPQAAKPHTMTGCLEKGTEANLFRLTSVEGTGPKTVELHAETNSKTLTPHVGHKVAITGTAVDPKTMAKGTAGTSGGARGQGRRRWASHACRFRENGVGNLSVGTQTGALPPWSFAAAPLVGGHTAACYTQSSDLAACCVPVSVTSLS